MIEKQTMKILTKFLPIKKIKSNVYLAKIALKNILSIFSTLTITGVAIATFSHFMVDLFGVSIPNLFGVSIPNLFLPGDNDWNDCPNSDAAWQYWASTFIPFEKNKGTDQG